MADIALRPVWQALDSSGNPVAGAKAYFYDTGTTNLQTVYTDTGLATPHSSPVVADSGGVFAAVYSAGTTALKIKVTDASDVTLYTVDPAPTVPTAASAATAVSFSPTARLPQTDVQAAIVAEDVYMLAAETAHDNATKPVLTGGSSAAFTYVAPTTITAYEDGQEFSPLFHTATASGATFNVDGVGAKAIKYWSTAGVLTAIASGGIQQGTVAKLTYSASNSAFVVTTGVVAIVGGSVGIVKVLDEDTMSSNSATWPPSQQSTKAYVDGKASLQFISSQDASASATLDFTGFDATTYDSYLFEFANLIPATDTDALWIRTSTDGGSTYDSGASDYAYGYTGRKNGASVNGISAAATSVVLTPAVGSAAGEEGVSGKMHLHHPHLTKKTMMTGEAVLFDSAGGLNILQCSGIRLSSADVDALRFMFSTGNIASGTITMYGLRNS
jgi:hypothetical protein